MVEQSKQSKKENKYRPYWIRFWIVLGISVVLSLGFNEASFLFQRESWDRAPQVISLVIPAGTAEEVKAGQNPPGIPEEMVFVLGDTLEVKNEDTVAHQMGPVWVPAGTTSRLVMDRVDKVSYSCSFQTSKYLGIDVRQPTTWGTRMTGLMLAAPTTAALLYLYSLLIFPVDKPAKKAAA